MELTITPRAMDRSMGWDWGPRARGESVGAVSHANVTYVESPSSTKPYRARATSFRSERRTDRPLGFLFASLVAMRPPCPCWFGKF